MDRQRKPSRHLTRKQLAALDVFLRHDLNYLANPAKLRVDSANRITKAWAREACERLVVLGVLSTEDVRPRKKSGPTRHYRLARTAEGFYSLIRSYLTTFSAIHGPDWPRFTTTLFESDYMRANLTPELVRRILSSRKVEIRYSVDRQTLGPVTPREVWPDTPEPSSTSEGPVALCFPVADPKASSDDLRRSVRPFGAGLSLGLPALIRVTERHYAQLEGRLLVLPILGLLQVSPTALLLFLGEWQPYESDSISSSDGGIGMFEHVLFQLVFAAVGDLSVTRGVPFGMDVTFAAVCPEDDRAQRHDPALLQLSWQSKEIIRYEAGFDSEHLFAAGEDSGSQGIVEVTRNPENCWVRVWWDSYPPMWGEGGLEGRIRYKFENKGNLERALTHGSSAESTSETRKFVERASWLGDAIWQTVATEFVFQREGAADVGRLHDVRKELTSNAFLGELAERIGLPAFLRVGEVLEKNPAATVRHQMHATHLEAVIGATFLDGGFRAAQRVSRRLLELDLLARLVPEV